MRLMHQTQELKLLRMQKAWEKIILLLLCLPLLEIKKY